MQWSLVSTELGGVPVLVEAVALPGTQQTARPGSVERAHDMFSRAQTVIEQFALSAVQVGERVAAHSRRPDEIEIQFGLKFSVQGDVVIASAGTEASLSVKIVYRDALADPTESSIVGQGEATAS